MVGDLPKINHWNSELLNFPIWSNHPEIKTLCDNLYAQAEMFRLATGLPAFTTRPYQLWLATTVNH